MKPMTVASMPTFIKAASKLFTITEVKEIEDAIAYDPFIGDVMAGTGGFRKMRFGRRDAGKSGGARVIYWYFNNNTPILLFFTYPKNQKDNLTKAQRNELFDIAELLKAEARRREGGKNERRIHWH